MSFGRWVDEWGCEFNSKRTLIKKEPRRLEAQKKLILDWIVADVSSASECGRCLNLLFLHIID
jgi:hypothetical protein